MLLRMRRSELLARRAIASFRNEMRRLLSLSSPTTIEIQREGEGEENLVVLPRVRACLARFDGRTTDQTYNVVQHRRGILRRRVSANQSSNLSVGHCTAGAEDKDAVRAHKEAHIVIGSERASVGTVSVKKVLSKIVSFS